VANFSAPPPHYWSLSSEELMAGLGSGPQGLSSGEAAERLARFGHNSIGPPRRLAVSQLLLRQFKSPLMLILIFATAISLALGEWVDASIILTIVLASGLLSFYQEYSANAAAERLRARVSLKATVLRDGSPRPVPAEEVVPGDVVLLSAGSLVPADGVVLEQRDILVNQAVLTGETYPVEKRPGTAVPEAALGERANSVFMSTDVRSGSARVLVAVTGQATAFGEISQRLQTREPATEFEQGIYRFGTMLMWVALALLSFVFAVNVLSREPILDSFLFSLALAVGIAPELLPAIITINLARGSQRMAAGGVIVRRLAAIEDFGGMDVLCTDKTGTLTEGEVALDAALDEAGQPSERVFFLAYLNARLQAALPNPLDDAIVAHARPDISGFAKVDELPYDFQRRRLSVVVENEGRCQLVTKGAFEHVLAVSSQLRRGESNRPLDEPEAEALRQRFADYSSKGLRVFGLATKEVPRRESYELAEEEGLTFEGFLLFSDPPKQGIADTIRDLKTLGVSLKVITGDNRLVARHTAQAIGLLTDGVLTGGELRTLTGEALRQAVEQATIIAEVDPGQKEGIILALREGGHVTGFLGDGINDAPALHSADVGISVDTAVDVAKEAADFVLLEKDLAVLHQGIVQGRTTFANCLKYVFITTSANFGNTFSMAGASLFLPFLPMLPKQILLTNFLTDFPSLTMAGDTVDPELVRAPRRWDVRFVRQFMLIFGAISSAFDFLTFATLLVLLPAGAAEFRTGWFVESVLTELLILVIVRTQRPVFRSRPGRALSIALVAVAVATLALPYSPFAGPLGFAPLPAPVLAAVIGITALYAVASEAAKCWFFRRQRTRADRDVRPYGKGL